MIVKDDTEEKMLDDLDIFLNTRDSSELELVEEWLKDLTKEELNNVCCGDITIQDYAPSEVNKLLNDIFDEVG